MAKRAKPCRKCDSKDIKIWDCGYSSFNVGGAKCNNCGHEVKLSPCGCYPRDEIISAWNRDSKEPELIAELLGIEKPEFDFKAERNGKGKVIGYYLPLESMKKLIKTIQTSGA